RRARPIQRKIWQAAGPLNRVAQVVVACRQALVAAAACVVSCCGCHIVGCASDQTTSGYAAHTGSVHAWRASNPHADECACSYSDCDGAGSAQPSPTPEAIVLTITPTNVRPSATLSSLDIMQTATALDPLWP